MRALMVATLLMLGACGAAPAPSPVSAALKRFAEAAQFLAPGFSSYSFAVQDEPDFTSEVEHYWHVVIARSGSDFQKPKDLGAGRSRGVEVRDYGAVRVSLPWREAGEPAMQIAGVPVWLGKGCGLNFDREEPLWTAIVDSRFHVRSHDRDQLEAALRRSGRLEEIVRPFEPVAFLPEDVRRVICLLPRPEDSSYWSRPIPIEPMVIALCPTNRLLVFHRLPLPPEFRAVSGQSGASRPTGGWTVAELVWAEDSAVWADLRFATLFGLAIFV